MLYSVELKGEENMDIGRNMSINAHVIAENFSQAAEIALAWGIAEYSSAEGDVMVSNIYMLSRRDPLTAESVEVKTNGKS